MKDSREFKDSVIRGAIMDLLSAGRVLSRLMTMVSCW
jgi:hypothetical protein